MTKILKSSLAATAAVLVIGISSSAFAWGIQGKVDIVDLRSGGYNGANSLIYVAPISSLPSFRYLIVNQLDRCNNLASDALGDNSTVIFRGSGSCATTGTVRRCENVVTRCSSYRNR